MHTLLITTAAVLLVDRLSKRLVRRVRRPLALGWRVCIRYVANTSRRLPATRSRFVWAALWGLAFVSALVLASHASPLRPAVLIGLGGALGGAAGNLVDRLRGGGVIDFIDLGWWPVFNLADVAITVGLAVALPLLLFS